MNAALFAEIESPSFSAQLNVVSGYNQFVRALPTMPEVQRLLAQVRSQDEAREVFCRTNDLVVAPCDPAFENPFDVALASYLWILKMTDPELASLSAEKVLACPSCWWARKLAEAVLAEIGEKPPSATGVPLETPTRA